MVSSISASGYAALTQATQGKGGKYDIIAMAKILADETGAYTDDQKFEVYDLLLRHRESAGRAGGSYVLDNFNSYTFEERSEYQKLMDGSSFVKRVTETNAAFTEKMSTLGDGFNPKTSNWNGELATSLKQLSFIKSISDSFTRRAIDADSVEQSITTSIGYMTAQNKAGIKQGIGLGGLSAADNKKYLAIGLAFLNDQKPTFGTIQDTITLFGRNR
jgi:hypothetical protein